LETKDYQSVHEQRLLDQYVQEARNQYLKYLEDKISQLKENIELNAQTIEYLALLINQTIASITDKEGSVYDSGFSSSNQYSLHERKSELNHQSQVFGK
jgi:hypothetical protein